METANPLALLQRVLAAKRNTMANENWTVVQSINGEGWAIDNPDTPRSPYIADLIKETSHARMMAAAPLLIKAVQILWEARDNAKLSDEQIAFILITVKRASV